MDGTTIVLLFQHTVHATMLAGAPQPLLDAVHEVLGGTWQVRCEARDTGGSSPPAAGGRDPDPPEPVHAATEGGPGDWPEPARPGGAAAGERPAQASPDESARSDKPPRPGKPARSEKPARSRAGQSAGRAAAPPARAAAGEPGGADEVDEVSDQRSPSGSGEQQALELLQRSLGAEKIGEVAP